MSVAQPFKMLATLNIRYEEEVQVPTGTPEPPILTIDMSRPNGVQIKESRLSSEHSPQGCATCTLASRGAKPRHSKGHMIFGL